MYKILLVVTTLLPSFTVCSENWKVSNTVFRGVEGNVSDVFVWRGKETKQTKSLLAKPLALKPGKYWISSKQLFLASTGLNINLRGRIWIEHCQPVKTASFIKGITDRIRKELQNTQVKVSSVSTNDNEVIACLSRSNVNPVEIKVEGVEKTRTIIPVKLQWPSGDSSQTNVYVEYSTHVAIATKQLKKQAMLNESNTALVSKKISNMDVASIIRDVNGLSAKKMISKGDLIAKRNSMRTPLVKKGEVVKVVLQGNGFTVRAKAKALENAMANEAFNILVDNGTGPIKAIVNGKGVVHALH